MKSEDALDSKETAKDITNFNRRAWLDQAEELCFLGIREKFVQNDELMEAFKKTENKTLIEVALIVTGNRNTLKQQKLSVQEQVED